MSLWNGLRIKVKVQVRHQLFIVPLLPVACCLIAGIVIGRYYPVGEGWLLCGLCGVLLITLLLRYHPRWQTAGIWLATILLGMIIIQYPLPDSEMVQRAGERMLAYRDQLLRQYQQWGIGEENYAIVAAMTLGDKTALTPDIRESFNITGAGHVLAISGLHLGILYMMVSFLVRGLRLRIVTQVLTILLIWAFAFLVGMSPSVVRSATMLTIYGLLSLGYRQKMSINVLAFTAIVLLVLKPQSLFDIGFQMSFLAVLAILLCYPLLNSVFSERWMMEHRLVRWLWGMTALSLSAQIGVAPLIAFYFHRFSTYFLLSNFVVIPCAYLILVGAILLFVMRLQVVATVLTTVTTWMRQALNAIATLPYASIDGLYPTLSQTILIYIFILLFGILLTYSYLWFKNLRYFRSTIKNKMVILFCILLT